MRVFVHDPLSLYLCVCVSEREGERERDLFSWVILNFPSEVCDKRGPLSLAFSMGAEDGTQVLMLM